MWTSNLPESTNKDCFIIMPISDVDGYPVGHFGHVFEDIIRPACERAGYNSLRADQVKETNLIHLDILNKLIDTPIAVCDLSTRNPNVMFELGLRQAFDKPVVLIQEKGTPRIFDISPLRYLEYSKEMKYHEVLQTQKELEDAITATVKAGSATGNVNSIVKLLALQQSATIPDIENGKESLAFDVLQAEMRDMRKMMEMMMMDQNRRPSRGSIFAIEYERLMNSVEQLINSKRMPKEERLANLQRFGMEAEELMMRCDEKQDHFHMRHLMERIHRAIEELSQIG
jgi:hypothetical protein